jgi:hypothetical protein
MGTQILESTVSRYKDTSLYTGERGLEYALFEPPKEFETVEIQDTKHNLTESDIGNLDALAVRYFGRGYEQAWWAIALYNGIIDEEFDLSPGDTISIPSRAVVNQFIARAGNG